MYGDFATKDRLYKTINCVSTRASIRSWADLIVDFNTRRRHSSTPCAPDPDEELNNHVAKKDVPQIRVATRLPVVHNHSRPIGPLMQRITISESYLLTLLIAWGCARPAPIAADSGRSPNEVIAVALVGSHVVARTEAYRVRVWNLETNSVSELDRET
jgi:hypothetical protein